MRDEAIATDVLFRNDAPSIALDPQERAHVLFASASASNVGGFLASRLDDGTWQVAPGIDGQATGSLVFGADGAGQALIYGPSHSAELWRWSRGWSLVDSVASTFVTANSLALGGGGCLHAAVMSGAGPSLPTYLRRDRSWTSVPLPHAAQIDRPALALSPAGRPYVVSMSGGGFDNPARLVVGAPAGAFAEVPESAGRVWPSPVLIAATTAGPSTDRLHLFFQGSTDHPSSRGDLVYATRAGDGAWSVALVASEVPLHSCPPMPSPLPEGEKCAFEYIEQRPLAVIASGNGDVRALYARVKLSGLLTRACQPAGNFCRWQLVTMGLDEGRLEVAWNGSPLGHATVLEGLNASSGTAALDRGGRIHLAIYDASKDSKGANSSVRYLVLGGP